MKITINIPSYKRPVVKTLQYIPFAKVWVDESEYDEYCENNPGGNIISCPKGIQGNLCRVRNYILDREFEDGADVVLIVDDDLFYVGRFVVRNGFGYCNERLDADELMAFLEKYSIMANDLGAKFWGVNCNDDFIAYHHDNPFSTKCYIGGPFQCFLKGNECRYDESLPLKEDYDMTLQQLNRYRVVLRVNAYHYVSEQSTITGGCAMERNRMREQQQFELLQQKWGSNIVKRDKSNKGRSNKIKMPDYNPVIKPPIKGV